MLKIEAQSSRRISLKGFSSDASRSSLFDIEIPSEGTVHNHLHHDDPPAKVLVSVVHSPLHMGCFLRCPPSPGGYYSVRDEPQICPAFSLANPTCAGTFPLRRCDVGGVRASEVGELLAAAASVEGEGGDGIFEGRISAEEVPRDDRLRYRYRLGYLPTLTLAILCQALTWSCIASVAFFSPPHSFVRSNFTYLLLKITISKKIRLIFSYSSSHATFNWNPKMP